MNARTALPSILAPTPAPPSEESPSELWVKLTQVPRPHKIVPFPRRNPVTGHPIADVAIWPLTQEEQMIANAEADRWTKSLLKDPQRKEEANLGYNHTFTNDVAIQILWRACRDPKDLKRPAFPSPGLMRKEFSTDETGVLFNHYLTVQLEVGPIISYMTEEEVEGMILRLHQGGSTFPFDTLSWDQQRTLVSSMASQLVSCWMAMSSAGLPLDASTYVQDQVREMVEAVRAKADAAAAAVEAAHASDELPSTQPAEG